MIIRPCSIIRAKRAETRLITRAVDPAGAHDRHRRALIPDHALQQPLARDLRPAVGIGLHAQRRVLVGPAAHVVAVHGDGADVDEPADPGCHGALTSVSRPRTFVRWYSAAGPQGPVRAAQ